MLMLTYFNFKTNHSPNIGGLDAKFNPVNADNLVPHFCCPWHGKVHFDVSHKFISKNYFISPTHGSLFYRV